MATIYRRQRQEGSRMLVCGHKHRTLRATRDCKNWPGWIASTTAESNDNGQNWTPLTREEIREKLTAGAR